MSSTRTVLIDGDVFAYKVAAATQSSHDFGDETGPIVTTDLEGAWESFEKKMDEIISETDADDIVMTFSDPAHNWRKNVLPSYKGNRKNVERPLVLSEVKARAEAAYRTFIKPALEADDVLGILLTHPTIIKGEKICATIDKDLLTVPGLHFNPDKVENGIVEVSEEEGNWKHLQQALMGDSTDGYKGCPGVGPKKSELILPDNGKVPDEDIPEVWEAIVEAYAKAGLTEEDALIQARVARIMRHTDFNFKTKEPILWEPHSRQTP